MNNAALHRRNSRRKGCRRNRAQRGGNTGQSYAFAGSVDSRNPSLGNAATVVPFPSCGNPASTSHLSDKGTLGGLPGSSVQRMYGGTYAPGFEVVGKSAIALTNPLYSGCGEGLYASKNQLNEASLSTITAPPPTSFALKGGKRRSWSGGAAAQLGTAPVGAMLYEVPRSGYTTAPSNSQGGNAGVLADGKTPFLVNVPYTAQPTSSPACLKTGGSRKRRKSRKGSRKSRKNRKNRR